MSTQVVTGRVRFSYVNIIEPSAMEGGKPKYSVSLIIDKDDEVTVNKIEAAIEAAKQQGKSSKWGGKIPTGPTFKIPLRDGDEEKPDNEEYKNSYFVNANNLKQPPVVDATKQDLLNLAEVHSGCYGKALINFYPFNASGNKGIAASLNGLQFLESGESLGGVAFNPDVFGDEEVDPLA